MKREDGIEVSEIVQISPDYGSKEAWAHVLVIVTEVHEWGIVGACQLPNSLGVAYVRAEWAHFERTGGRAEWLPVET